MDKFILAMIALAVILAVIIGGGFIAVEYTKTHPEMFEVKPERK